MHYKVEKNGSVLFRGSLGSKPQEYPSWQAFIEEHPQAELDLMCRLIKQGLKALNRHERVWLEGNNRVWIGGPNENQPAVGITVRLERNDEGEERTYYVYIYEEVAAQEVRKLEYHDDTDADMAAHFAILALATLIITPAFETVIEHIGFGQEA